MKSKRCEKHQNYKYMNFCPFCKVSDDRDALIAKLKIAEDALEYVAWPGPERDHWDRMFKAKDALADIRK